jgi:acid phosphatase family membrane protein YuiD
LGGADGDNFRPVCENPAALSGKQNVAVVASVQHGGMPSSHSSAVTALSTAVGIREGFASSAFAISAIIGMIVMFDAAGVRRHAGMQAEVLNRLVDEFNHLLERMKMLKDRPRQEKAKKLKELLGHQPIEVFMGGTLGIVIALLVQRFYV